WPLLRGVRASFGPYFPADQLLRQDYGSDALIAESLLDGAFSSAGNFAGNTHAVNFRFAQLEHRIDDRSHRHLPRIELLPLAAHRDKHEQRKPTGARQRKHVDAIAEPA